jgi:Flp pilus assembly protein TadG
MTMPKQRRCDYIRRIVARAAASMCGQRRAVAAVEFAIIAPVLLLMLGSLVDTGMLEWSRSQLAVAVANGIRYAMLAGPSVTASAVQTAVNGATTLTPITVSVTAPSCYCSSHSGTTTTLTAASSCTTSCLDGYKPGKYTIITATYTYPPIMPLLSKMTSIARSQSATVRLQ